MKILLICKDRELISEAQAAFEHTDDLSVFSSWHEALDKADRAELMIADILALLDEPHRIGGYEEFAKAKMGHAKAKDIPVVAIAPPGDYELDAMVGWPDFLFGMVRRPVTMKIFRRISTWV